MPLQLRRSRRTMTTAAVTFAALATLALAGCGSDDNPGNPTGGGGGTTTYRGTISGSTTSGTLTLTISTTTPMPQPGPARAAGIVTATGSLALAGGGSAISLTGNYDTDAHAIGVAGSGWTFAGGLTAFGMEGGYSGPGGETGVFSVQTQGSGADTVIVVVGTFTSTSGGSSGNFNFSVRGGVLHGNAVDSGDSVTPLDGTYTAGTGAISVAHPLGGAPLATGTLLSNGTASGTFDDRNGNSGTWAGTRR